MRILSIEPTPSPNSMKVNLDERLPAGQRGTYTPENKESAPEPIQKILGINGVKSVFHASDFLAVERIATADWPSILNQVREAFGEGGAAPQTGTMVEEKPQETWGEVTVFVQMFRNIPMQIKLQSGTEELRVGLPDRFKEAALKAQSASANLVMERQWVEQGPRYGTMQEIGEEMARELDAAYDQERLDRLVEQAFEQAGGEPAAETAPSTEQLTAMFDDPDWKKRYAALQQLKPDEAGLRLLEKALSDANTSIRRLAVAYLGDIKGDQVLPLLYGALADKSVIVRRTAGDVLSDIGDPQAIPAMCKALKDPNKLVRWRAARFLYEVGDESAIPALREAVDDPEFEVSLQVRMALERIEAGEEAAGSVWQQMTRRNDPDNQT
ncbi:conserved virulence factor C family protein [Brevibacillus humidisoli]|uniref:conserved virulence factor C family protein n=1 Tax=Brevibacillus humidisoli TaxID=2895522 RepID=UPI001E62EE02|nr:conserved virulence factor C family protein [Brevibacillus humidisoli]UFJ38931.1 conserved virulence factor C family protein [Brevibacillus humidisoli]